MSFPVLYTPGHVRITNARGMHELPASTLCIVAPTERKAISKVRFNGSKVTFHCVGSENDFTFDRPAMAIVAAMGETVYVADENRDGILSHVENPADALARADAAVAAFQAQIGAYEEKLASRDEMLALYRKADNQ